MLTRRGLALRLICVALPIVALQSCATDRTSVERSVPSREPASTAPRAESHAAPPKVTMDVTAAPFPN